MIRKTIIPILFVCLLFPAIIFANDERMRCGPILISNGDHKIKVMKRCGEPIHKEFVEIVPYIVEQWVYPWKNGSFMVLTFKGGKIINIEEIWRW